MRNIIIYFCFLVAGSNIMSAQNYFSMEGKSVQQDVDFEFDIFVNSDVKVGAFQFDIEFEESFLEFGTVPVTSLIESFNLSYKQIGSQTLRVIGYTTNNQNTSFDNTPILRMKYKSLKNPADISPTIRDFVVSDISGNKIDMYFETNTITILGPKLFIEVKNIDFGQLLVGQTYNTSFSLYNTGSEGLVVSKIILPTGVISNEELPFTINPGENKSISLNIDTSAEIAIDGIISFETSDTNEERAAQSVSIKGTVFSGNELFLSSQTAIRGEPTQVSLLLENQKECLGVQFDLKFPENFILDTNSIELTDRISEHNFSANNIGNNTYRFLIYSLSNQLIKENQGALLTFEVTPNDAAGQYQIEMYEAVAMDATQKDILSNYYGTTLEVTAPTLEITPSEINLNNFNSSVQKDFSFSFYNSSSLNLKIDSIVYNKDKISFTQMEFPIAISPFSSETLNANYSSTTLGAFEETITIHHNGQSVTDNLTVSGTVVSQNYLYNEALEIFFDDTETLQVKLINELPLRGLQFDLSVDQNINIDYENIEYTSVFDGFSMSTSTLSNGNQRFLIYSAQQKTIPAGDRTIINLPVYLSDISNSGSFPVSYSQVFLSGANNSYVQTEAPTNGDVILITETSPVLTDQTIVVLEDEIVIFDLIATDRDGDELSYTVPEISAEGGVLSNSGKEITYAPKKDFFGTDEFAYEVTDGTNVLTGKTTFNVTPVNDLPTINDYSLSTKQNNAVEVKLTSIDVDSPNLTFEIAKEASFGVAVISADTLKYIPNQGFHGLDELSIKSFDGSDYSENATVSISVSKNKNASPLGANLNLTTNQDESIFIKLIGTDAEGDQISFEYTEASNGIIAPTENSNIIEYTPNVSFFGEDSFTYTVSDDKSSSSSYTIGILVYELINLSPTLSSTNTVTSVGTEVSVQLVGNDPEGLNLSFSIAKQAENGTASISRTGLLKYIPGNGFTGSDTVNVLASDGIKTSDPAQVVITVEEANNTPPVGISNSVSIYNNTSKNMILEAFDSDNDPITYTVKTSPSTGTLSQITDSLIVYTPKVGFSGEDTFEIIASDGKQESTPFKLYVNVIETTNSTPVAISYSMTRNPAKTVKVIDFMVTHENNITKVITRDDVSVASILLEYEKEVSLNFGATITELVKLSSNGNPLSVKTNKNNVLLYGDVSKAFSRQDFTTIIVLNEENSKGEVGNSLVRIKGVSAIKDNELQSILADSKIYDSYTDDLSPLQTKDYSFEVKLYGLDSDPIDKTNLSYTDVDVTNGQLVEQNSNIIKVVPVDGEAVEVSYKVSDGKVSSETGKVTAN